MIDPSLTVVVFPASQFETVTVECRDSKSGAAITYSAIPPTDRSGIWFDTTTGIQSVWYLNAWIAATGFSSTPSGAIGDGGQWLTDGGSFVTDGN